MWTDILTEYFLLLFYRENLQKLNKVKLFLGSHMKNGNERRNGRSVGSVIDFEGKTNVELNSFFTQRTLPINPVNESLA